MLKCQINNMFTHIYNQILTFNRRLKSFSCKIFVFLPTFILLLSQNLFFFVKPVYATSWYNSSWHYRKALTIDNTNNSEDLTDYQVKVKLNSSNFDFSKAQSDGDDLRFTDSDGVTLLNHWTESYSSSSQAATVWVKIPTIPASSSKTIYMYYGNDSASSISNGDGTFEFFDDFESQPEVEFDDRPFEIDYTPWKDAWKPIAVHYQGNYDRTYLTWINKHGTIFVGYYDHSSGAVSDTETVGYPSDYVQYPNYAGYPIDVSHAKPSIAIDNNGYIYVFYGSHNSPLTYRKSNNPEDITSFSSLRVLSSVQGTYPSPIVTDDNKIIVLYRQDDKDLAYIESSDGGETWSDPTELIDAENAGAYPWIYPEAIVLGSESPVQSIHILGSRRIDSDGSFEGLYYLKSTDGGSTWKKADDTTVTLPATVSTVDIVDTGWGYPANMKLNSSNVPYIVYNQNKTYYFSKWNGSNWTKNLIASGSATFNIEYLDLDIIDDNTIDVYLVEGTVANTPGGNIQRWRSTDGGKSWSKAEDITSDGNTDTRYEYPHVVKNYNSYLKVFYFKNELTALGGRRLTFKSYPNQIPAFTFTDYLKSGYAQWGKGENSGYWGIRENQLNVVSSDTNVYKFSTDQTKFSGNIAVHWKMKNDVLVQSYPTSHSVGFYPKYKSSSNNIAVEERQKPDGSYELKITNTATGTLLTENLSELGMSNSYEFDIYGESVKLYRNGVLKYEGTIPSSVSQANASVGAYVYSAVDAYYDDIFVRQYTSPEPSISVGSQENESTAPTGSVSINSGNDYTTSTSVTLTISATDNFDPASSLQMQISNISDFSGASWESYTTSKFWTVTSGDGIKTVYIRFKDADGNTSTYSDSITYDITSPSSTNFNSDSPADSSYTNNTKPTFRWHKTTDATAGLSKYQVIVDPEDRGEYVLIDDIDPDKPSNKNYREDDDKYVYYDGDYIQAYTKKSDKELTEDKYTWKIRAVDKAGNSRDTGSKTLYIDTTAPTLVLTDLANQSNLNFKTDSTTTIFTTSTQTPTFKGIADAESTIKIMVKSNLVSCETTTSSDSSWECTPEEKIAYGIHSVSITATDRAGNTTTLPKFSLIISKGGLQTEIIEKKVTLEEEKPTSEEKKTEGVEEAIKTYTVKIKVVDINKKPVKGARVILHSEPRVAITDENGEAVFENVEKGEHKVVVAYKGYVGEQKVKLEEENVKEIDLTVQVKEISPFLSPEVILIISLLVLSLAFVLSLFFKERRKRLEVKKNE